MSKVKRALAEDVDITPEAQEEAGWDSPITGRCFDLTGPDEVDQAVHDITRAVRVLKANPKKTEAYRDTLASLSDELTLIAVA